MHLPFICELNVENYREKYGGCEKVDGKPSRLGAWSFGHHCHWQANSWCVFTKRPNSFNRCVLGRGFLLCELLLQSALKLLSGLLPFFLLKTMVPWSIAAVWHSQAHFFGRGFQRKPGRAGEQVGCRHLPWHGSCLSNSPGKLLLIDTFSFAFSPNYCWVFVVYKPPACPLPLWWAGCHFSGSCWLQYRWNFLTHTSRLLSYFCRSPQLPGGHHEALPYRS